MLLELLIWTWAGVGIWFAIWILCLYAPRRDDEVLPGVQERFVTYDDIRRDIERRQRIRAAKYPEIPVDTEQHTLN